MFIRKNLFHLSFDTFCCSSAIFSAVKSDHNAYIVRTSQKVNSHFWRLQIHKRNNFDRTIMEWHLSSSRKTQNIYFLRQIFDQYINRNMIKTLKDLTNLKYGWDFCKYCVPNVLERENIYRLFHVFIFSQNCTNCTFRMIFTEKVQFTFFWWYYRSPDSFPYFIEIEFVPHIKIYGM